eukprot:CAMPEP_0182920548 /NCGR_PEP_ID=MMETSP0105_2-20130417/3546_1 /TAXON_ID=81532 ORGANISM="Acanthoeca-like sp., Strain 10tr" /NCGR_SAMPLE_ID=MMETSP0105_2 /ASSEMBLY_ACC=CAM_ASM_000205 /LENGTH=119 /DNA_ID=CAMNT_0025057963 /DNA_START=234 /DNA_END=592 /DNA_ORIENTATION=+
MEFDSGSSPITTNRLDGVGTSNGNGSVDKLDGWDMSTAVLPREAAIERCVLLFEHACQCRAAGVLQPELRHNPGPFGALGTLHGAGSTLFDLPSAGGALPTSCRAVQADGRVLRAAMSD